MNNVEIRKKRNAIFDEEKKRQFSLIKRIEKIHVEHVGPPETCTLIMNKGLSTPFNCAMHIQELLMTQSVIALVNGKLWDIHCPLTEDCELRFMHFKEDDCNEANEVFWRSCSFILGHILETAFKDEHPVELCSFPLPNVKSGSFVYDADLKLPKWRPTQTELNCLSRIGSKLQYADLRFEPLDISTEVALKMFSDNRFKMQQIPEIAATSFNGSTIRVYRMGDHIDISRGPMMSSTALLGRFSVTAVHHVDSSEYGPLQRVQGVALPKQFWLHQWTYELLEEKARQLNTAPSPRLHRKSRLQSQNSLEKAPEPS